MAEYLWQQAQALRLRLCLAALTALSLVIPASASARQSKVIPHTLTDADVFMYQCVYDDYKVVLFSQVGETNMDMVIISRNMSYSGGSGVEFKDGAWREVEQLRGGLEAFVDSLHNNYEFSLVTVEKFEELLNAWPDTCGAP